MFNMMKTAVLMAAITALFMAIGSLLGGRSGMMMALLFALGMNFFSYWFSDKLVLKMYNAHEVDASSAPQFYAMVRDLAQRAGLPMPRVYLIDEDAPNAFATGRNPEHAAVAATTGILRVLIGARAARRDGARAGAREAPRHPDLHRQRDDGRRDLDARQLRDVLRRAQQRGALAQPASSACS